MNRSSTRNIKGYTERTKLWQLIKPFVIQAIHVFISLAFSNVSIFGGLSPLGLAFVGAVDTANLPAALLGSVAGYLITSPPITALRYIAALAIVAISAFSIRRLIGNKLPALHSGLISLFACLATGMAVLLTGSITLPNTALYLSEAIVAGGATFFLKKTFEFFEGKKNIKYINAPMLTCLLISFGLFLLSMEWISFGGISLARITASFIVLLAAYYSKEFGGAIAGIASGISLSFSSGMAHILSSYASGGLLAGFFSQYGRFPSAICFMAANAIFAFTAGDGDVAIASIIETATAALIFTLLPSKFLKKTEELLSPDKDSQSGESYKNMLRLQLAAAAGAMGDIASSINTASRVIKKLTNSEHTSIFEAVQNDVCSSCVRKASCWEYNRDASLEAFAAITGTLRTGKKPVKEELPNHFGSNCRKIDSLLKRFEEIFIEHRARGQFEGKANEVRSIASEQFNALSVLLENLTENFTKELIFHPETADNAKVALISVGVNVREIFCISDEGGQMHIQALCGPRRRRVTNKAVTSALYDSTGLEFDSPVVIEADGGQSLLLFCEKTELKVSTGSSQYVGEGQKHSGDAFDYFLDGRGNYLTILSDGMGTGARAAIDGTMTSSLTARLVKAGFEYDSILKTVNSALMLKSKEESLSTLDIFSVNLYSGEAAFLKAGAAASFIHRNGKTMKIECASLPLGILKDVAFGRVAGRLQDGDIVIIASDGAAGLSKDAINEEIAENEGRSAGELAGRLAKRAKHDSPMKIDDISIIVSMFHSTENSEKEKPDIKEKAVKQ